LPLPLVFRGAVSGVSVLAPAGAFLSGSGEVLAVDIGSSIR
jgi:hypothetical protein